VKKISNFLTGPPMVIDSPLSAASRAGKPSIMTALQKIVQQNPI